MWPRGLKSLILREPSIFLIFTRKFSMFLRAPKSFTRAAAGFFSWKPIEENKKARCERVFSCLLIFFLLLPMESEKKKQKLDSNADQATMSAPKTIPGECILL